MKDVTSTSFGLVIAFLLPGLSAMACVPFWWQDAKLQMQEFARTPNNVGLSLMVLLAGVTTGLEISVVRSILFEKIICRRYKLLPPSFKALQADGILAAFRAAADEHYRYHQFWGGMAVVFPFAFLGILRSQAGSASLGYYTWNLLWGRIINPPLSLGQFVAESILFVAVELLTACASNVAFRNYVNRSNAILKQE